MTVTAALLDAGVFLAVGLIAGAVLALRLARRSKRAKAERVYVAAAKMLRHIIDEAPLGIVVVDSDRGVVFANARAGELALVHDRVLDDRAWLAVQRTIVTGEDTEVELSPRKTSGLGRSTVSVRGYVRLLPGGDASHAVLYVDDQSEHARMEATRRDFVANVSHELKTPVSAMKVLAEALLESADDPATVRRFGSKVLAESNRLAKMVGELIDLSRLQGAERLPDLCAVDVDSVVAEAISRQKVSADSADIEVITDVPSGYRVLGDQPLLVTALANLVSNGIAYSHYGSTVSISRRRNGENIEIAVTDRGIGIAGVDQERVFERFFRVDKARSRATGGTGLGLAIVKHVAANHNGSIRLWSRPGTGSTFTLSIPEYLDAPADTTAEDLADTPTSEQISASHGEEQR